MREKQDPKHHPHGDVVKLGLDVGASGSAEVRLKIEAIGLNRFSVGLAALQLANWAGAVPVAATRTSAKALALQQLGAKHVIATEETDLIAEVQRITGGKVRASFSIQ